MCEEEMLSTYGFEIRQKIKTMEHIKSYIDSNKDRFLSELFDLLRIPSVSADPKYKADVIKTAEAVKQSLIAIGSGGLFGKGWLNGTQSHLQFLPEHSTDFIFAVAGEEFGFMGSIALIILLLSIVGRGLYISIQAQDTFSRLLAGSISLTFFICFFVNMSMVTGILPVVGIPLPLVSYGGTSMVTIMAGFGILMSIHTHRQLIRR